MNTNISLYPKFSVLCLLMIITSSYADNNLTTKHYDIFLDGSDIGDLTLKTFHHEQGIDIVETSHIDISGWWGSVNILTTSIEKYSPSISFKESNNLTLNYDGNEIYQVIMNTDKHNINGSLSIFEDISKNDILKIESTSKNILTDKFKLYHKNTFNEFADTNPIRIEKFLIPKRNIHTSINALPIYIEKHGLTKKNTVLKIIDLERIETHNINLQYIGEESIQTNNHSIKTHHYKLIFEDDSHQHLWINSTTPYPYMVRYTWRDDDGTGELLIKK